MSTASLASKPFLKGLRTDGGEGISRLGFKHSDVRGLSPAVVQISIQRRPSSSYRRLEVQAIGNEFGNIFRVSTYGESHGGGVGCIISGCPPRIPLSEADMQEELDRRRPGQSRITTPRKETDTCTIISGISEGMTTGTPIAVIVPNTDQRGNVRAQLGSLEFQ